MWNKRPGAVFNKLSLLVWDMFVVHHSEKVKKVAENLKTTIAVIPGGLTSLLQPLDVCLNKPFKDNVQQLWANWISSGLPIEAKAGNLKKTDIVLMAR